MLLAFNANLQIYKFTNLQIMRNYILPQTEAQTICVSQLMTGSVPTTIETGNPLNGEQSGGMYV